MNLKMLATMTAVTMGWTPGQLRAAKADPVSTAGAVLITAAADAAGQPIGTRPYLRYLSLGSLPPSERAVWAAVLSYHCNALSTRPRIVQPALLNGIVLRVDLRDYGWDAKTWDSLPDPYHYAILDIEDYQWFASKTPDGKWDQNSYEKRVIGRRKALALAPWIGEPAAAKQLAELCVSQVPIVDARFFLWQTALQADRKPGYYDFLGIKNKADWEALVGRDARLAAKAKRVEVLEAVGKSEVTLQPRRIGAFPGLDIVYETFDSAVAEGLANPLEVLNGELRYNAQEVFGSLPNGIPVWGLFIGNDPEQGQKPGDRADSAPDKIASDSTSHSTDRRVHVNLSCIRCHGQNDFVQPVDEWLRSTLKQGPLKLQSPDYDKLQELQDYYLRELKPKLQEGRDKYKAAVKESCGMELKELAKAYGDSFAAYEEPVRCDRAARDAGMTEEQFVARLREHLRATGYLNFTTAQFLGDRKGGLPIRQYHEQFGNMMQALMKGAR